VALYKDFYYPEYTTKSEYIIIVGAWLKVELCTRLVEDNVKEILLVGEGDCIGRRAMLCASS